MSFKLFHFKLDGMLIHLYLTFELQCASAIDHMATFYFNHIIMGESPASPALLSFAQHISDCADVFLDVSLLLKFPYAVFLFMQIFDPVILFSNTETCSMSFPSFSPSFLI